LSAGDSGAQEKAGRGVRIELVCESPTAEGTLVYRGFADAGRRLAVEVFAGREGARAVIEAQPTDDPELVARLEKLVAALVRAATRAELEQGRTPPRKIVRWRSLA
jgi:hypothetical protein